MNEKLENLSNVLKAKDEVIDKILNDIAHEKNDKDDYQNELLFKKNQVESLNMDFNNKEGEY